VSPPPLAGGHRAGFWDRDDVHHLFFINLAKRESEGFSVGLRERGMKK